MQVLQERGYELTSVAEIAERAGVHETSIYRRWGTKEALLLEAVLARMEEVIRVPDTGALRSDLVQLLQELRTFFQSPLQLVTETVIGPLYVRLLLTGEPLHGDLPEQIVDLVLHGVEVTWEYREK